VSVPASLRTWAAKSGPAKLLETVRIRARRGQRTEAGALKTLQLTETERREIALVLGTDWEISGRPPRLQDFARYLADHGLTVRGLVEQLDGRAITPDAERRSARQAAEAAEVERAVDALIRAGVDEHVVRSWVAWSALPRPGAGELLELAEQVARVWTKLPAAGARLAHLAATTCQNAHALDADRLLGRAVARMIAINHGLEAPRRAGAAWRSAWQSAGVLCDGVSVRVLTIDLPLRGTAPAVELCAAAPGEPTWLTLRALAGRWYVQPTTVFVCENVTIIEAAADALGFRCPPMVCTDGIASGAALDLLSGLAARGCHIRYRADFDAAGFVIADQILGVAPSAVPWRFDAQTYLRTVGQAPESATPDDLRTLYEAVRVDVHEEQLLPDLITDLRAAGAPGGSSRAG
jgi:uncharacterized protein (TIGR02679 family)